MAKLRLQKPWYDLLDNSTVIDGVCAVLPNVLTFDFRDRFALQLQSYLYKNGQHEKLVHCKALFSSHVPEESNSVKCCTSSFSNSGPT